jgi:hypothetical protein
MHCRPLLHSLNVPVGCAQRERDGTTHARKGYCAVVAGRNGADTAESEDLGIGCVGGSDPFATMVPVVSLVINRNRIQSRKVQKHNAVSTAKGNGRFGPTCGKFVQSYFAVRITRG